MSIEAEPKETSVTTGDGQTLVSELAAAVTSVPISKPKVWRRRRYQLAAVALALLVVAAAVGNNVIARQYSPDGAVRQYLGALQSGDGASAWSVIEVSAPTQPVKASLTDQEALRAALAAGKPDIKSFTITSTSSKNVSTAVVAVSYDTSKGSKQANFVIQRSGQTRFLLYPVWRLVIMPTLLTISLPKGSNGVSIDGKALALPEGKSTVAVLPVLHKLQFTGTQMLASQTVRVDSLFSLAQSASYQPALTTAGLDRARSAIKAAFATCAQQGSAHANAFSPCPQSADTYFTGSGQWQIIGDPLQDLSVRSDSDLNLIGIGHYQMVFAYHVSYVPGTLHEPASGAYGAPIVISADDLSVSSIKRGEDVPALQRPAAATDLAAKDLVSKAFTQCAAIWT